MSSRLSSTSSPPAAGARRAPFAGRRYCEPRQPSPRATGDADGLAGILDAAVPLERAVGSGRGQTSPPTSAGRGSGVLTNTSQVGLPCLSSSPRKATTLALPSQPEK